MDFARYSIERSTSSWVLLLLLFIGGLVALSELGRLEDPEFTIKQAMVVTSYPGASPQQVEEEVTVPLENVIKELPYVDHITSTSRAGLSQLRVEMKDSYRGAELAQIWDEMRRRVTDLEPDLPPGVQQVNVIDDFADVYGVLLALTAPGYDLTTTREQARRLRRELALIEGVGKVVISGERQEQVAVEISRSRLANLEIPPQRVYELLATQNTVSYAGRLRLGATAVRLATTGEFSDISDLQNLVVSNPGAGEQILLSDVAEVRRIHEPIPTHMTRFNGSESLWLGISFATDVNVVKVGEQVNQRLAELNYTMPVGMELTPIYNQPDEVEASVNSFLISLIQAVVIVMAALLVTMGLRSGFLIGFILLTTVLGTFIFMSLGGINLHRVSLGALIIALGMLVDNAIVVTEGMLVGIQRGKSRLRAARDVLRQNQWPLLGATLIAIIAFAPIGLSDDATGEFTASLFWVIFISLGLSWFTAVLLVPFLGDLLYRHGANPGSKEQTDIYAHPVYRIYKTVLTRAIRWRLGTVALMLVLLAGSVYGFTHIRQSFFPNSTTPVFYVDLWYSQGTDIRNTAADAERLEQWLLDQPETEFVASTIGQGAPRFTLTYLVESAHENYGQLIVRAADAGQVPELMARTRDQLFGQHPAARGKIRRMEIGPPVEAAIEARFSGPDPDQLRQLSEQAQQILTDHSQLAYVRDDWREPAMVLRPQFNQVNARRAGITKQDVDDLLLANFRGKSVGLFRDGTELLPIIVRAPDHERVYLEQWQDIQLYSPNLNRYVPMPQVIDDVVMEWEDAVIQRRDRKRTLTVMGDLDPLTHTTPAAILAEVRQEVEALPLPPGYTLSWGGEHEASSDAQQALFRTLPLGYLAMFIITILLFSSFRRALAIWTAVPLSIIGVTFGLWVTGQPFSFMALLGIMSLTGMLLKNGIVLLEQVKTEERSGKHPFTALVDASVSRVRPVSMAAITTILGMIPLLFDVFFASMAVTIMFGLGFATLLTLLVVPITYSLIMRVPRFPSGD